MDQELWQNHFIVELFKRHGSFVKYCHWAGNCERPQKSSIFGRKTIEEGIFAQGVFYIKHSCLFVFDTNTWLNFNRQVPLALCDRALFLLACWGSIPIIKLYGGWERYLICWVYPGCVGGSLTIMRDKPCPFVLRPPFVLRNFRCCPSWLIAIISNTKAAPFICPQKQCPQIPTALSSVPISFDG